MRTLFTALLPSLGLAAQPAPPPSPAAVAAARAGLVDELTDLLLTSQGPERTVAALMGQAQREEVSAARGMALMELALRCCIASQDLRAAEPVFAGICRRWAVHPFALRSHWLQRLASQKTPPRRVLALCLLHTARLGLQDGRPWTRLAEQAEAQAQALGDQALLAHVRLWRRMLQAEARAWAQKPAPASLELGELQCYQAGDWARGLPLLAAADPALGRIAAAEARPSPDARSCSNIAAFWLDRARHREGQAAWLERLQIRSHALDWYYRALPQSADLERHRLLRRIRKLEDQLAPQAVLGRLDFAKGGQQQLRIFGGEHELKDGRLLLQSLGPPSRALLTTAYESVRSLSIRGEILTAPCQNFRIAIGDFCAIFNWEAAKECHFFQGSRRRVHRGHLFKRGTEHEIRLRQLEGTVQICFDGVEVYRAAGRLAGTVCVYPALGSRIALRSIRVDGQIDRFATVTGPSGKCW